MHFINWGAFFLHMRSTDIIKLIEDWAPKEAAWQKDNVGLQVGSAEREVENIFLCLELTEAALKEAIKKKCNLVITHHPFIYQPIKKLEFHKNPKSKLIEILIKNDISLYSAHTNLDFTREGVSFALADKLELKNIRFLHQDQQNQFKVVIFVPPKDVEVLSQSIFKAGGGVIGLYDKCSFRTTGQGTFEGSKDTNPIIGKSQNLEFVDEIRLEVVVDSWKLNRVLSAIRENHPYEQPAYDIYPLHNINVNYGSGVIGELANPLTETEFLSYVSDKIELKNFRYAKGRNGTISAIAVCGGSGSELLDVAIEQKADAFITADIKYHTFQDAESRILMIDAGHYETEIFILERIREKIKVRLKENKSSNKVFIFSGNTNPVRFYKF